VIGGEPCSPSVQLGYNQSKKVERGAVRGGCPMEVVDQIETDYALRPLLSGTTRGGNHTSTTPPILAETWMALEIEGVIPNKVSVVCKTKVKKSRAFRKKRDSRKRNVHKNLGLQSVQLSVPTEVNSSSGGDQKEINEEKEMGLDEWIEQESKNQVEGFDMKDMATELECLQGSHEGRRAHLMTKTMNLLEKLWPSWAEKREGMRTMMVKKLERCFKEGDTVLKEDDAIQWATKDGVPYRVPASARVRDSALFEKHRTLEGKGNLKAMAKEKLDPLAEHRLSVERLTSQCNPDNPYLERAMKLATVGMNVNLPEGFVKTGLSGRPKLSKQYLKTAPAVNKMFMEDFWEKDLALLVTKEQMEHVPDVTVSLLGWAEKELKEKGRPISNMSSKGPLQPEAVNNPYSKQACLDENGEINHPTIRELMEMILELFNRDNGERKGSWEDIRIWKMDFKGAFTLLTFNLEHIQHVCMEMTEDLFMVFLCGVFGWTGTPAAFNVISQLVLWELKNNGSFKALARMFCDDLMAASWEWNLASDMKIARELCQGIMGQHSMELTKEISGVVMDLIGYELDMPNHTLGIKQRNISRALYGFMMLDESKLVTRTLMERISSWAGRYSNICEYLLPLTRTLYAEYQGRTHPWLLTEECKVVIKIFRAFLLGLDVDSITFARTVESFARIIIAKCIAEYDASLSRIGVIWYLVDEAGVETPVGYASWDISSLNFGTDSSNQNTAEFIAGLLALIGVVVLGLPRDGVKLRGDSKSALAWAHTRKFRSERITPAAMLFVLFMERSGIQVVEHEDLDQNFIDSKQNWRCDELSRDNNIELIRERDPRFIGVEQVKWDNTSFLALIKPEHRWVEEDEFCNFWRKANDEVSKLMELKN